MVLAALKVDELFLKKLRRTICRSILQYHQQQQETQIAYRRVERGLICTAVMFVCASLSCSWCCGAATQLQFATLCRLETARQRRERESESSCCSRSTREW